MRAAFTRLLAVMAKETIHLRRDRLTIGMIAGIPLIQVLLFGYAIDTDVRNLSAVAVDAAGTAASRQLLADLGATQVVRWAGVADTPQQARAMIDRGEVHMAVLIPADFGRRLARSKVAAQLLVDASDPLVLATARSLVSMPRDGAARAVPIFEVRPLYNPERRSAVFVVPGLIGVILTMTMVLFTAAAIVRERERGNLELLIATPVSRAELMVGKVLPYVLIGLVQVALILALGVALFDVPIRGEILDLYLAALLFVAANLTLGLLLSTLATSQFQAMQMTFFFFLPSILLSGFMFPFDGMPRLAQSIAELLPLTHFLRIVRGVILRGAELADVSGELWALAAFLTVTLVAAALRFSKRLD